MSQYEQNEDIEFIRHVYRASSPTVTRQENRIKELEELLDIEREVKIRLERANLDLSAQLDDMNEQIEEFSLSSSQYNDAIRKREIDYQKLRKDFDCLSLQMEMNDQENRKKNHNVMMEMTTEMENLQRLKQKQEKEKIMLMQEIETTLSQLDSMSKTKSNLEAKLENLEIQNIRFKSVSEDQDKQIREISILKAKIYEDNLNLKIQIQEVNHQNNSLRKSKSNLEEQLGETKKQLEEETRAREIGQNQLHQIQNDNEQLRLQFDDETDNYHRLQTQLSKLNSELLCLKSKCDKEINQKTEEFEELKRRSTAKINELLDNLSRETLRTSAAEKSKQQLSIEINDLYIDIDRISTENEGLHRDIKSYDIQIKELHNRMHELEVDLNQAKNHLGKIISENNRLKSNLEEEELKSSSLSKENVSLSNSLRDEKDHKKALHKELMDIHNIKNQLEADRLNLIASLEETKEMLVDAEHKLQGGQNALLQLKLDMEQRLQEKDEELMLLKKNSQRTIEELTVNIVNVENKYKSEINKVKKKLDDQLKSLQNELVECQKENEQLLEEMKEATSKLQEIEESLEEERRNYNIIQEKLISSDKRKSQMQGDLEDSNRLLEASDKSRKKIQMEIEEISMKLADSVSHINILNNEKRKLESEVVVLHNDLDDATTGKLDAEERATKMSSEINRMIDENKQEHENHKKSENARKSLANELREMKLRLDERESSASKEISKSSQLFQDRIREIESELELERSRNKEAQVQIRKQERTFREIQQQAEDDRRTVVDLQQLLDGAYSKLKTYKRQMDELECSCTDNLNKYKRAQKLIDEAEHRASIAERKAAGGASNHFLSQPTSSISLSSYSKHSVTR